MRPGLRPEGLLEHLALWGNLGPLPVAEAMFGMATSRVLMAGVRLGLFEELVAGPKSAEGIAGRRGLDVQGTQHLLDCLTALGHVERSEQTYRLNRRARRWLDPASPTYIGAFLEFNYDQWDWWGHLEEVVTSGVGADIHAYAPDDPRWERYITAMFQLARLSAPEVARNLRLPAEPKRLLDLAGGHGWFAAELCRRYPHLQATVLDLAGSVAVGRQIMAENGMAERVRHVVGDMMIDDLGEGLDGVLCFQIIHHLTPDQNVALLSRVHAALRSGGVLAVLDYFTPPDGRRLDSAAFLGLHFFLTSTAATYSVADLQGWLREAGFHSIFKVPLRRLPVQTLFQATA